MTQSQLEQIDQFQIWNEHGKIEWLGKTDLTEVNLGRDVKIVAGFVNVQCDNYPLGNKLNKPAIVRLKNIKKKRANYEEKLKQIN